MVDLKQIEEALARHTEQRDELAAQRAKEEDLKQLEKSLAHHFPILSAEQREELTKQRVFEERIILLCGIASALAALAFPAYQTFLWLQSGVWTPLPISSLMSSVPTTDWVGLQKIITWVFDLPILVIPAFVAGMFFCKLNESRGIW